MIAQKKVLWRGYFRCAESFVLKRKGGGDLAGPFITFSEARTSNHGVAIKPGVVPAS